MWHSKALLLIGFIASGLGACAMSDDNNTDETANTDDAVTRTNGEFIIRVLANGEVDRVDPILSPGVASPVTNTFFGVENVTSTSQLSQLETHPTTAQDPFDTAAYWGAELFWQGVAWHPGCTGTPPHLTCGSDPGPTLYARAYYTTSAGASTVQLPRVVMETGYPNATKDPSLTDPTSDKRVYYTCGATPTVVTPNSKWPYDCSKFPNSQFDGVVAIVDFPQCWNGKASGMLNGEKVVQYIDPNVKSGVTNDLAYPTATGGCPSGFAFRIPRVSFRTHTKIKNPASDGSVIWPSSCAGSTFATCQTQATSPTNIGLGLSTKNGVGGWYTFHAGYIQSWQMGKVTDPFSTSPPPDQDITEQPGTLNDLTEDCLDHPITCGFQPNSQGAFVTN
jgi:hypothetical protein